MNERRYQSSAREQESPSTYAVKRLRIPGETLLTVRLASTFVAATGTSVDVHALTLDSERAAVVDLRWDLWSAV